VSKVGIFMTSLPNTSKSTSYEAWEKVALLHHFFLKAVLTRVVKHLQECRQMHECCCTWHMLLWHVQGPHAYASSCTGLPLPVWSPFSHSHTANGYATASNHCNKSSPTHVLMDSGNNRSDMTAFVHLLPHKLNGEF